MIKTFAFALALAFAPTVGHTQSVIYNGSTPAIGICASCQGPPSTNFVLTARFAAGDCSGATCYLLTNDTGSVELTANDYGGGWWIMSVAVRDYWGDYWTTSADGPFPNDNGFHTLQVIGIQAGGQGGVPYYPQMIWSVDGHSFASWQGSQFPGLQYVNTWAAGNWYTGPGCVYCPVSRIEFDPGHTWYDSGNDMLLFFGINNYNAGYGGPFFFLPSGEVSFTIDECPGC